MSQPASMKVYKSTYPPVDPLPRSSVFTLLFNSRYFPGAFPNSDAAPAYIDAVTGRIISRSQLKELALQWAYGVLNVFPTHHKHLEEGGLGNGIRLRRGDTVLIFSPNSIGYPIVIYGCVAAGLRVSLANGSYTPSELEHQYEDSGSKVIFVHPSLLRKAFQMFDRMHGGLGKGIKEARKRIVVIGGDDWGSSSDDHNQTVPGLGSPRKSLVWFSDLLGHGALTEEEKFEGDQVHETVFLCYSSGTTGKPKGVETTHFNITSMLSIVDPAYPALKLSEDVMLGVLPFYHIYGLVKLLQYSFRIGLPVVIMPRFELRAFCSNVARYKVTMSLIVPPILVLLANHSDVSKYNMSSLRILSSGAAPLGSALVEKVKERLRTLGAEVVVTQGYGLTETSPTTHFLPIQYADSKIGSMGHLLCNMEARFVDEDGNDAEEGQVGELWMKGPLIMKGYLNNPEATKASITPDGWFKSGDIGMRDKDGFYYIVDRKKELIKYKGFQVAPAELESVLLQHPDIVDAAVVGIESPSEATELPRAYIVHRDSTFLKSDAAKIAFGKEVQRWIQGRVARHKFLRGGVLVIDAIPKSPSGKILRRRLRDRAKTETEFREKIVKAKL